MTQQELIKLLKKLQALHKECEWIEFKMNNANPQEIGEYLSALSNSACYHTKDYAYLVFGIEDGTQELKGTSFRPLQTKVKNQELENWLATQLNPRIDFNIYEFDFEAKHFALFRIPATRNTPISFRGEHYIRIGSYKKRLDDHPERERQIWQIDKQPVFENEIAKDNVNEDDVLKLIDYPKFFEMLNLSLPDNRKGILDRMLQEKIIVKHEHGYDIKNIGALLFAKHLEDFEQIGRKAVRIIFYNGNNRTKTIKERIGVKGYAVDFENLIKYLDDNLPSNENIDKALRQKICVYPIIAVRELVANALIHQDFSISGTSPMIEIFSNRMEITNPGKPVIDSMRFIDHNPESRNELLARFMRRLNICEERGSGFDKIVLECEYNQLPAPEIIVNDRYTRIILYARKTLRQMDKQDKIRACYQHACLRYVSGEYMTNQSLRERFDIKEHNSTIVSRIIIDTIKAELIKDYDTDNKSRKFAKYVPYWL
ncbi:MAG: putative DNA binding domain-containing protein [Planctomycetaceae bacterium]|jgi:predicted HTH transcriptional regulator|nr:putative DNA binding domain-containing protein [Planctomycetaceae bacterium]